MGQPVKVFISYAHEDETHKEELCKQLQGSVRSGLIELWHDRDIVPGSEWHSEICRAIEACDIAVILVSADFLASDFIYDEELKRLKIRRERGQLHVVPVIVRPCRWRKSFVGEMQVVPANGRAITTFNVEDGSRDQAWADVGQALESVAQRVAEGPAEDRIALAAETATSPAASKTPTTGDSTIGDPALEHHYSGVIQALMLGRLVVFFGEEVNECGRSDRGPWAVGSSQGPPSWTELSQYLAGRYDYPAEAANTQLVRVSQYVALKSGPAPLYDDLHDIYDADFPGTALHRFFATLPARLRDAQVARPCPVIITVNYDDVMERAYREAGEQCDIVCYLAEGPDRGRFAHVREDGRVQVIDRPNEYADLALDERPLILKLQGTVDRGPDQRDSFVITEDDYIAYITRADLKGLLPPTLVTRLLRSHYLFLGHRLSDWNLRMIVHRLFGGERLRSRSWAVRPACDALDRELWHYHDVSLIECDLERYAEHLEACMMAMGGYGRVSS